MMLWLVVVFVVVGVAAGVHVRSPWPAIVFAVLGLVAGIVAPAIVANFQYETSQEGQDAERGIPRCTPDAPPSWTYGTDAQSEARDAVGTFQRYGWSNVTMEYNPYPGVDWLVKGFCRGAA